MNLSDILAACDHTLLSPTATWEEIRCVCDEGIKFATASVCIPPCFVKKAKDYVGDKLKICTVIGFPLGYSDRSVKVFEAREAVLSGADEIDMVINIGMLKECRYDDVLKEINDIKAVCGKKVLKVIIETCLLTDEEKVRMCKIVSDSNADFIKTSTGFSHSGATDGDIILLKQNIKPEKMIKAAGGILSLEDARRFLMLGAKRLGTSKIVKLVKNEKAKGDY